MNAGALPARLSVGRVHALVRSWERIYNIMGRLVEFIHRWFRLEVALQNVAKGTTITPKLI